MIRILEDGPYIHRIGHLFQPDLQAAVFEVRGQPQLGCAAPARRQRVPDIQQRRLAPRIEPDKALRRQCGILRPGSSARSTMYAALLGKALLDGKEGVDASEDVGISVNCTTACGAIAWKFEQSGLLHGWENADTMLMPASIPTAVCTQIAAAVGARGLATAIHGGAAGMCTAFEYAHLCLHRQRVARFLLIGVDELESPHADACKSLSIDSRWPEGCSGLLLSRQKPGNQAWRVGLLGSITSPGRICLPSPWNSFEYHALRIEGFHRIGTSSLVPLALLDTLERARGGYALLRVEGPGRGLQVFGLIQDENNAGTPRASSVDA